MSDFILIKIDIFIELSLWRLLILMEYLFILQETTLTKTIVLL